jgi:hypothetical protein
VDRVAVPCGRLEIKEKRNFRSSARFRAAPLLEFPSGIPFFSFFSFIFVTFERKDVGSGKGVHSWVEKEKVHHSSSFHSLGYYHLYEPVAVAVAGGGG